MMYLSSHNPNDYGTVEFVSSISKDDKIVEYRVVSLSTTASFSLTTKDDYIIIEHDGEQQTIFFDDRGEYSLEILNKVFGEIHGQIIDIDINDKGLIVLSSHSQFTIIDASHRVQLILGIYHQSFPIESQSDPDDVLMNHIISLSIPYWNQGQVLYLLSRTDAICLTNARGSEEARSISFKTHEFIVNGYPIVSTNNGNWFKIKSSQLQHLKFTLVDFMLEPIVLHAPLYLTIEIIDERQANERFKQLINITSTEML